MFKSGLADDLPGGRKGTAPAAKRESMKLDQQLQYPTGFRILGLAGPPSQSFGQHSPHPSQSSPPQSPPATAVHAAQAANTRTSHVGGFVATRGVLCGVRVDDVEAARCLGTSWSGCIVSWLHNLLSCWPWCGNPRSKSTRVLE